MSRFSFGAALALLGSAVAALSASAQDPIFAKPASPKLVRLVYPVCNGTAKDLAQVLFSTYGPGNGFHAAAEETSNSLLISGTKEAVDEALALVRQLDRPVRTVHIDVILIELAGKGVDPVERKAWTGPVDTVLARVRELQKSGVLTSVKHMQTSGLEKRKAVLKIGENRPFVTGAGLARAGITTRSISYREVGTVVEVTPEVSPDGAITLKVRIEDSNMRTPPSGGAGAGDEKENGFVAAEFVTFSLEDNLRLQPGQTALAQATQTGAKTAGAQMLILISATADNPDVEGRR